MERGQTEALESTVREFLAQMRRCTDVNIDLLAKGLTDRYVVPLASLLHKNQTLTSLQLGYNRVGDEGACALAEALAHNHTLTYLDLYQNEIGPRGARALAAALSHNSTLEYLDLRHNPMEAEAVRTLVVALQANPTIKCVHLPQVLSFEEVRSFVNRYPAGRFIFSDD
ncbi:hypothetical protein PAPYR_2466 [Paratrimastix pyriformis]|uniref:Uncharacterized protein n=1 Tax=Paratrimastix pyriformis TaxID=342808 RepID=A0ABQ8UUI5_9EUKA|nr:hypothetical protein PAPYR_2466 [Paratrimastix pyriformis]